MRKRKGEGVVQSWVSNQWQQIRIGQQNWSWAFFYHSSKSVRILFKNECSSDLGRRARSLGTGPRNLHFNKPLMLTHNKVCEPLVWVLHPLDKVPWWFLKRKENRMLCVSFFVQLVMKSVDLLGLSISLLIL